MLPQEEQRKLVRSVDQQGCTGLILTAKRGDVEMANLLLDAGAIANDADVSGSTALHYAAGRSPAILRTLLDWKADAEKADDHGETPLMWARGEKAVQMLLEAGADPLARNASGLTALMVASRNGSEDTVSALVSVPEVEIDARDASGR